VGWATRGVKIKIHQVATGWADFIWTNSKRKKGNEKPKVFACHALLAALLVVFSCSRFNHGIVVKNLNWDSFCFFMEGCFLGKAKSQ
jgi:hypothetical protein